MTYSDRSSQLLQDTPIDRTQHFGRPIEVLCEVRTYDVNPIAKARVYSMLSNVPKKLAACLPFRWQQLLRRRLYARQIRRGVFQSDELEWSLLDELVQPGTTVLDIGANIGHYSARFSQLVGPNGRVIAFEPISETFELLTANAQFFPYQNVTLLNVAASSEPSEVSFDIPHFESGLRNYYEARINPVTGERSVICITVDSLSLPGPVSVAKIDVEGHEADVMAGMVEVIRRDRPVLIVENNSPDVAELLDGYNYEVERLADSHNVIFRPRSN